MKRQQIDGVPKVRVVSATLLTGGQSFYQPSMALGSVWQLKLECGHTAYRPVRYVSDPTFRRGWRRRRASQDALPAPQSVRCSACFGEQSRKRALAKQPLFARN